MYIRTPPNFPAYQPATQATRILRSDTGLSYVIERFRLTIRQATSSIERCLKVGSTNFTNSRQNGKHQLHQFKTKWGAPTSPVEANSRPQMQFMYMLAVQHHICSWQPNSNAVHVYANSTTIEIPPTSALGTHHRLDTACSPSLIPSTADHTHSLPTKPDPLRTTACQWTSWH